MRLRGLLYNFGLKLLYCFLCIGDWKKQTIIYTAGDMKFALRVNTSDKLILLEVLKTGNYIGKNFIVETGDTVVYTSTSLRSLGEPVIHRVVAKVKVRDGYYLITKGDNNNVIDQECGTIVAGLPQYQCITLYPIPAQEIKGRAVFKIPLVGYMKLLVFDDLPALVFGCRPGSTSALCNAP